MSRRGFLAILLPALLLVCCSETRRPARIVFQSNRDGNFEIYVMDADGSNQTRLTTSPANDVSPSWSPDGSMILFASDRDGNWEIYRMNADGSEQQRLTNGEGANTAPSWTADGKQLLFVSTRDAIHGEVYRMRADGQQVERVTIDPLVKDSPVQLPDGTALLATVNDRGRQAIARFARTDGEVSYLTPFDFNSVSPHLSADGSLVIYATDRHGTLEIYSMTPLGEKQKRITSNDFDDYTPAWTSTTKEILYAKRGGIYRLSLETRNEIMLSNKGDSAPRWFGPR